MSADLPPAAGRRRRSDFSDEDRAREIALRSLSAAARTRGQLEGLLARRGIPEETAARVLDRLAEVGLVDDAEYARMWVASRQGRGQGRRAILNELARKGILGAEAEGALGPDMPDEERARAVDVARKRMRALRGLPRATQERRLAGILARRGYPPEVAFGVAREIAGECADDVAATEADAD